MSCRTVKWFLFIVIKFLNIILKKGFIKFEEVLSFTNAIQEHFSDLVVNLGVLGYSIEKRPIIYLSLSNTRNKRDPNIPSILFTGLHHAREPLSLTMNLFIIVKTLFDFYHELENMREILSNSILTFVPVVNVDGYEEIIKIYENSKKLNSQIRKNRRNFSQCGR